MKKLLCSTLLLLILSMSYVQTSFALSCIGYFSNADKYDQFDAVILGEAVKVNGPDQFGQYKISIEVEQSFKTITQKRISIYDQARPLIMQKGEMYLFFLKKDGDGYLNTICSPTTNDEELINEFLADPTLAIPLELESSSSKLNILLVSLGGIGILLLLVVIVRYRRRR